MQFALYHESRCRTRKSNQDRVAGIYSRDVLLMLVADGMGGHLHGEIAAQIAVGFIADAFRGEARPGLADPRLFLRQAITGAHRAIIRNARDCELLEVPRTTCVACVVQDNAACWAHAGDSRLYHVREGVIMAQTKDHTLAQRLFDRGCIREEAVAEHPQRNHIFNCLGSRGLPQVDLSETTRLNVGDSLILCSDGLWGPLSTKIICSTVQKMGIMQAAPALLDEAERRAGLECDNLSAVAMTWEGPSRAPTRSSTDLEHST